MENEAQVTQTAQTVETQTQNNVVFDVNHLPPEFQRYLDQERTKASQTARKNARNELMQDETFLNEVRGNLTPQIEQTIEEQIKQLSIRTATSEVRSILSQAGIKGDEAKVYLDLFVSENIDGSIEKATNFVSAFNNTIQSRMDKKHQEEIVNMTTPQTNPNTLTEKDNLQAQLDEARKDTSFMRDVKISAIMRSANEKGIKLK